MKIIASSLVVLILLFSGCSTKQENSNLVDTKNEVKEEKLLKNDLDFINELALHDAIRAKDIEIVKDLVSHGIEINKKDLYGYSPLHLAVRFGQYDISELLISKGADVNSIDNYNDTPLLDSTRNGTNEISRLLLCNGANSDVEDNHKMKPIHNASKNKDLYIVEMIQSNSVVNMCEKLDITLDSYFEEENKICGKIEKGIAKEIKVTITDENSENIEFYDEVNAKIDSSSYCAKLNKKIKVSNPYLVTVVGTNSIDKDIEVSSLEKIKVVKEEPSIYISGLYEDLMEEFKEDFAPWNAELDKNGLVFRFKKPEVMFANGSSDVNEEYKKILNNFFPRYLRVVEKYKEEIVNIRVEGHTSSSYSTAKTEEEKYSKNKKLSEARAKNVYDYILSIDNETISLNKEWLGDVYSYYGMSSSDLILNEMGLEDELQSRRVEFRINKIKN